MLLVFLIYLFIISLLSWVRQFNAIPRSHSLPGDGGSVTDSFLPTTKKRMKEEKNAGAEFKCVSGALLFGSKWQRWYPQDKKGNHVTTVFTALSNAFVSKSFCPVSHVYKSANSGLWSPCLFRDVTLFRANQFV